MNETSQDNQINSELYDLFTFLSSQDNKRDMRRPIWYSNNNFLLLPIALTIKLCISFFGGFFSPMDALDSVMLTKRDKDHENHSDKEKEVCLFQLAENLGIQHLCAVMFPLQLSTLSSSIHLHFAVFCSCPLFSIVCPCVSIQLPQASDNMRVSPHLWTGTANDRTTEKQSTKNYIILMV